MKNINKEIKRILLSENESDLEKIKEYLSLDERFTYKIMFKVLEDAIKGSILSDIELILYNIEEIIINEDGKYSIINECVCETCYHIFNNKNLNTSSYLKIIKFRLVDINRRLLKKENSKKKKEEKNISICEKNKNDEIDLNSLEEKYHVSIEINDDAISQASDIIINSDGRRKLLSKFITIDGDDALCLDDALSLTMNRDGSYYFDVAITDIPSIIPYKSKLYSEAKKRIETLYLCDTIANLYPDNISNNIASLLPNIDKNVIVYRFFVDPDLYVDLDSLEIIKGSINVRNRFTYHDINNEENMDFYTRDMVYKIYTLAMNLRKHSEKDTYRRIENIIKSDANYHHSLFADKSVSANIIQESMILVNSMAPKYFYDRGFAYLYRNLIIPTTDYLVDEVNRLLNFSEGKSTLNHEEYKKLVNELKQIYFGAYYSGICEGHMGIGTDYYSHSTSSARRFADSHNQYLTHEQIFNGPLPDKRYYELEDATNRLANYINMKKKENQKFESEYNSLSAKGKILRR